MSVCVVFVRENLLDERDGGREGGEKAGETSSRDETRVEFETKKSTRSLVVTRMCVPRE